MKRMRLSDGIASAEIVPAMGAGLARYDLIDGGDPVPLFRPAPADWDGQPFDLGCIVLVPWSNRISGAGFRFDGAFHALAPNLAGQPFPIHGNGFAAPWDTVSTTPGDAAFRLVSDGPGPYAYAADLAYGLDAGALTMTLTVENRGDRPLPYGLGFHPWLPRTAGTRIRASATGVWLEDESHLPTRHVRLEDRPSWDFGEGRALPADWINNGFTGWNGRAEMVWDDRDIALDIAAEPPLNTYIVYSPSKAADFFCFEPISHAVDAHNLDGGPETHGLRVLTPGQSLTAICRFAPRRF